MNMREIRDKARELAKGACRVCPVCDGRACAVLMDRHLGRIVALARRMMGNQADADYRPDWKTYAYNSGLAAE